MAALKTVDAWRAEAKRRLPRLAFDFAEGGADDEVTLRRNRTAFDDVALVPRVLRGVEQASTDVADLFGRSLALPVLLAPTGDSRILGPQADLAAARGAQVAGTVSVLSGVASVPPEQIAEAVSEPQWAQIFLYRDPDVTLRALKRLKQLGFAALVVTVDGPVRGNRERDVRNGFSLPLKPSARVAVGNARHWRWMWDYFTNDPRSSTTTTGVAQRITAFAAQRRQPPLSVPALFRVDQNWDDLRWLRDAWDGPLIVKGVMCGEDADLAVEAGCDGVIVSNHGGRELDGAPASIEMLPEVVASVAGRAEVLIDSGFRRGTDVVKALSLGAKACLVGRPWLYAMAVAGEAGVQQMLQQLQAEILTTMQLIGVTSPDQLGPDCVRRRPQFGWEALAPGRDGTAAEITR
ncbi:hypothetical protein B1R94_28780 [Mycolicibacterium litorale]|nr:hypothetical protein B1R94_28780 [Mycolicibacterium litorale]